jgi:hypothetical protein
MKRFLLIVLCFFSVAFSFPQGGNANHPLPPTPSIGDTFVYLGTTYVSRSNTVQVDTIRILSITSNANQIVPGQTILVTMSVFNTGIIPIQLDTATIRMYTRQFSDLTIFEIPEVYEVTNNIYLNRSQTWLPGVNMLPSQVTTDILFTITVTTNAAAFATQRANPLVVDGYVRFTDGAAYYDDHWFSTAVFGSVYQYAAEVTTNWDSSGPPDVLTVTVTRNPTPAGIVTINVRFTEWMNTAVAPDVRFDVNGNTYLVLAGAWASNDIWAGTYMIPSGLSALYDGIATVSVLSAQDSLGNPMLAPSLNAGLFEIDTLAPTASLIMGISANVGIQFPVQFVVELDRLMTTPSVRLTISGNVTSDVVFTSNTNGTTWNGTVQIPLSAMAAIGSIATFSVPVDYIDDAGNTNNVLLGRVTVSIEDAVPIIVSVNFDSVPAFTGIQISPEPFVSVNIVSYRTVVGNPAVAVPMNPSATRITVDNTLIAGPTSIPQINHMGTVFYFGFSFYLERLSLGDHVFQFQVEDTDGRQSPIYIVTVNVASLGFKLVRDPVPFPNPFSPNGDGFQDTTRIVYQLTRSSDVSLYIYDLNGDLVWKRFIAKGQEGSHAGVNQVPWNGEASFSAGGVLPNGIYICHIVIEDNSQNKSLGRTKIMILK